MQANELLPFEVTRASKYAAGDLFRSAWGGFGYIYLAYDLMDRTYALDLTKSASGTVLTTAQEEVDFSGAYLRYRSGWTVIVDEEGVVTGDFPSGVSVFCDTRENVFFSVYVARQPQMYIDITNGKASTGHPSSGGLFFKSWKLLSAPLPHEPPHRRVLLETNITS